jgi:hypothetical protein
MVSSACTWFIGAGVGRAEVAAAAVADTVVWTVVVVGAAMVVLGAPAAESLLPQPAISVNASTAPIPESARYIRIRLPHHLSTVDRSVAT